MGVRERRSRETRRRILEAATESLIEVGYAATTTLAVQHRAGASRGSLLHHFPTREQLAAAAVANLVARNEQVAREALEDAPSALDPLDRALWMLRVVSLSPSMRAELELWAISRTDPFLREALRTAEKRARPDLLRVAEEAFGPEIAASPDFPIALQLSVEFMRGLSISGVLRSGATDQEQLLVAWSRIVRGLLEGRISLEPFHEPLPKTGQTASSTKENP